MASQVRLSHQTLIVLRAFLSGTKHGLAGSEIARETKIASGTLYPILARLEKAGWLTGAWEEIDPAEAGRPRKRFYHLTDDGQANAAEAFRELGLQKRPSEWSF